MNRNNLLYLVLFAGIALVPLAWSSFHNGNNQPFGAFNNDDNSLYDATLVSYSDTTDTNCNDTDHGIRPQLKGTMSWVDLPSGTFYNLTDSCVDSNTLREYGCVEDYVVHVGNQFVQYHNFATANDVSCPGNGFARCDVNAQVNLGRCI